MLPINDRADVRSDIDYAVNDARLGRDYAVGDVRIDLDGNHSITAPLSLPLTMILSESVP